MAKSQFLASMSHDLRTPMNAVLGMTDLALAEELSPTVRDYIDTARESAGALLELLNDILDLSRIEAGRLRLEAAPFRLRSLLDKTLKSLGIRAYEKGLELLYDVPDEVPDQLLGDALRVRQVLTNLLGNAIKFTHKGEITVRVAVRIQERGRRPAWSSSCRTRASAFRPRTSRSCSCPSSRPRRFRSGVTKVRGWDFRSPPGSWI